jgi:regulator of sirC expression with transglutaminase-like and TPR domain
MQTVGATVPFDSLTASKRDALITLLADDDIAIYQAVRSRLLDYGPAVCDWLRPFSLSSDPKLRRRAAELLTFHARNAAHQRFVDFCQKAGESADLELGAGLLAKTRFPEVNLTGYSAVLDEWAEILRNNLSGLTESGEILGELNRYLFDRLGFAGNEQYGLDPDCSYFSKILDRRNGNPIGLCLVYLLVARRLQLPITGIGLPAHFICRYQSSTREIYVDCFRRGAFLSKGDCVKYLLQARHEAVDGGLSPVSNRRMLLRMCVNLLHTYRRLEMDDEASRLQIYVQALGR